MLLPREIAQTPGRACRLRPAAAAPACASRHRRASESDAANAGAAARTSRTARARRSIIGDIQGRECGIRGAMILTPRQKSTPDSAMFDADRIAQEILEAWRARRQIPSLAARLPGFDLDQAYQVTAALRRIRQAARRTAGRAQDRLHQPHHLGRIPGLCADLGRHVCDDLAGDRRRRAAGPVALSRAPDRAGDRLRPCPRTGARHGRGRACSAASPGSRTASRSCIRCSKAGASPPPTPSPPSRCTAPIASVRAGRSSRCAGRRLACGVVAVRDQPLSQRRTRRSRPGAQRAGWSAVGAAPSQRSVGHGPAQSAAGRRRDHHHRHGHPRFPGCPRRDLAHGAAWARPCRP